MKTNAKFVRTNGQDQDTFIFKGQPRPGVFTFEIETPASRGTFKHETIRVPYDYILNFLKPLK
jgi:hypothetical protein